METISVYKTDGTGPIATFLQKNGLQDDIIPVGDWNWEGYLRVATDHSGHGRFWGGRAEKPVLEFKPWPEGFDFNVWLELTADEEDESGNPERPEAA